MKSYLAFLFSLLIISCNPQQAVNYDQASITSLKELEKKLYSNNSSIIDSIILINKTISDKNTYAYANLLHAIAHEQKFGIYQNDSLIWDAAQFFKQSGDNYNYARALLYTSIAQYSKARTDSTAFHNLSLTQTLFNKHNINEHNLYATLYLYLGRFYRYNISYEEALQFLEKSLEHSKKAVNNNAILNASLEIFNIKLIQQKYAEALSTISYFGDATELSPHIAYKLYNSLYNYYSAKKEPQIAIEYLKKNLQINTQELLINTNKPKTYYQLATLYKRLNMGDSSLHYAQAAVQSITDSLSQESHFYYRYLADILYENKQYMKASDLYKSAHLAYITTFTRFSQQRDLEIKAKFNFDQQEKDKNSFKSQRTIIFNLLFIVSGLLIMVALSYYFYSRKSNEIIFHLKHSMNGLNKDIRKSWLISEIFKTTSYILPQFIDNVTQEAARSRIVSKEMFESLNRIIDVANSASRSSLTDIANHEEFIHIFGNIHNLDSLTDFEKLVYALNEEGYSNSEIAYFLNSSQSSIRTIRGKILRKLHKTETNIES